MGQGGAVRIPGALILTPFYYDSQMSNETLIRYFTQVADNSEVPVLIYNVPKFTHVNISAEVVRELSRHPNIIGMKDSVGDVGQLVKFMSVIPEDFNLIVGTASAWYPALTLGIRTGIMALANCMPRECIMVQKAYEEGRDMDARELYQKLFPVNTAVTATFGISGLKYACELMGYQGGSVRSPLLMPKEEEKRKIEKIISEAVK